MNFNQNLPAIATTVINPSTIVELDNSGPFSVKAATGPSSRGMFIAQEGSEASPNLIAALGATAPTTQPAAQIGDGVGLFGPGDICDVLVGSATVDEGTLFKNDANAAAIPASSGNWYTGVILAAGSPGDLVPCLLSFGVAP